MSPSGFEVVEHTADLAILAKGDSKAELFVAAAEGMCSLMYDIDLVKGRKRWIVEVDGDDDESLLVAWLNELLYLNDSDLLLFKNFEVIALSSTLLKASVTGELYDEKRHRRERTIKAATYHLLKVAKNERWHAQIIFDV